MTILAALAAFTACSKSEAGKGESKSICLTTFQDFGTRADEPERSLQPLFLFWTDNNFNDATKVAPDFFVRTPDGEIEDYKTTPYNTGVYYPLYNKPVKAAGLAPAPGEGFLTFATAGDYRKFNVAKTTGTTDCPDDEWGVIDVLAAPAISATDAAPFTVQTPLYFHHRATKVAFKAQLTPTMTKFVKFVKVEIPGSSAVKTVEWNATAGTYDVKGGADTTDDYEFGNFWTTDGEFLSTDPRANATLFFQVLKDKPTNMGYTLIAPHVSSLDVVVKFKMANSVGDFDTNTGIREVSVPVTINFKDASDNDLTLEAGDAYTVLLYIDALAIELVGKKVAWEDGGYISLPFQIR